ncbi:MAG TPA: pectate lyase [Povalibacter sp.]|nr:pectate lyase [Povalibacter sp.]
MTKKFFAASLAFIAVISPAAVSASVKWGSAALRQPAEWYASKEARAAADSVLTYQSDVGAWPKNTDLFVPVTDATVADIQKEGKANTIDNGATTTPIRFIALVAAGGAKDAKYREAVLRGVDYLLASQYANGGFPQFYPLRESGYYSHITYNDDAMINALELLRDVAQANPSFAFVDKRRRERARDAVARGIDVILKTQVRQDGKLTAWCAQHDEVTLAPAWARAYEPPSLSGDESVGIVRFLMAIEKPSPQVVTAIESAVSWFRAVPITGQRLESVRREDGRNERFLVPDPAAPPLWARFYELGTNRPLYMDRDSKPHYDFSEIGYERRSGYNYHGTWPASLLGHDYPAWRARIGGAQVSP